MDNDEAHLRFIEMSNRQGRLARAALAASIIWCTVTLVWSLWQIM